MVVTGRCLPSAEQTTLRCVDILCGADVSVHVNVRRKIIVNPLMGTLKPQINGYNNTVIDTLAVDGWAVTFGTARRGLGGCGPAPVSSSLYQMYHTHNYSADFLYPTLSAEAVSAAGKC